MSKFYTTLIIIFFLSSDAYAYFDPGSGAFIIQSIIAFISAIIVYLTSPITWIKKFFKDTFRKKNQKDAKDKNNSK